MTLFCVINLGRFCHFSGYSEPVLLFLAHFQALIADNFDILAFFQVLITENFGIFITFFGIYGRQVFGEKLYSLPRT